MHSCSIYIGLRVADLFFDFGGQRIEQFYSQLALSANDFEVFSFVILKVIFFFLEIYFCLI